MFYKQKGNYTGIVGGGTYDFFLPIFAIKNSNGQFKERAQRANKKGGGALVLFFRTKICLI